MLFWLWAGPGAAVDEPRELGQDIVSAARAQIGRTTRYEPAYVRLAFPGGDVPMEQGVCSDVVIRALRGAAKMDLQSLLFDDMQKNFALYPKKWGQRHPDRNIDHRRVLNLEVFFDRRGYRVPLSREAKDFQPGDLVTALVPPNLPHIMIVSDQRTKQGVPLIIHNIGKGTMEEDRLFEFRLTGHFRVKR